MLCPITNRQVDEKGVRLVALFVVLLVGGALALGGAGGAALLAGLLADFTLRGGGAARWSPLAAAARAVLRIARARPVPTNAGPKMFAARLGAVATAIVGAGLLLGAPALSWAVGGLLMTLAGLEAGAGVCVGCRLYALLVAARGPGAAGSAA